MMLDLVILVMYYYNQVQLVAVPLKKLSNQIFDSVLKL